MLNIKQTVYLMFNFFSFDNAVVDALDNSIN